MKMPITQARILKINIKSRDPQDKYQKKAYKLFWDAKNHKDFFHKIERRFKNVRIRGL